MIQFNLLPEVTIEYIKARRTKRMIIGIALLVGAVCATIFIILYVSVTFVQPKHIGNLTNDIADDFKKLQSSPDVNKMLTVQRQLNSLTKLHENNPSADRFPRYLSQLTPQNVSISTASIDYPTSTIQISGTTDTLATVNKFVDTLKFTTYNADADTTNKNAFTQVVLNGFGVTDKQATYQLSFKFDYGIFDNTKKIKLTTPNIISTRSNIEKPTGLFQPQPTKKEELKSPLLQ